MPLSSLFELSSSLPALPALDGLDLKSLMSDTGPAGALLNDLLDKLGLSDKKEILLAPLLIWAPQFIQRLEKYRRELVGFAVGYAVVTYFQGGKGLPF